MDFYADLVRIAKGILDSCGMNYDDLSDNWKIVARWINIELKLISAKPRNIIKSTKVIAKQDDATITSALVMIEEKFRNGNDINPHLSKLIFREDHTDYLFSDWRIYHLHLSTEKEVAGKNFIKHMKRSDWLLFVVIHPQSVYFMTVPGIPRSLLRG